MSFIIYLCIGELGKMSRLSDIELLGLGVASAATPFFNASGCTEKNWQIFLWLLFLFLNYKQYKITNSINVYVAISKRTFFLILPRLFSALDVSIDEVRLLIALPGFASGLIIHHDDLPVPSFWTRINRLWRDRLCRIEFCNRVKIIVILVRKYELQNRRELILTVQ